jgi:hypothetical protein
MPTELIITVTINLTEFNYISHTFNDFSCAGTKVVHFYALFHKYGTKRRREVYEKCSNELETTVHRHVN